MKKILKIFCCALAVCSVNVGVVKADTINNEELWENFQQKRENIISKIIVDEGAEVKGIYFSAGSEEEKDKRLWQEGSFFVKMNITKKQSENIFEDIVKKIWYGERMRRDLEKDPLTKEELESINKNKTNKLLYNVIFIGLTTDRQVLYDKINKRVDEMISQGLLEEVKSFYDKGIKSKPLLNAIGYRELYNYLDGNCTKEEAIEKIKQNSRHYAKRQYTFFNHQLPVVWFETDYNNFNNTIEKVASYIDSN